MVRLQSSLDENFQKVCVVLGDFKGANLVWTSTFSHFGLSFNVNQKKMGGEVSTTAAHI